jgi:regulator of cell morphogenesis and NO signaling
MVVESQSVGEIASRVPGASRIFESHHIDYGCDGTRTLREACAEAHVPLETVLAELDALRPAEMRNWASLSTLVAHIIDTHHAYAREAITRLPPMMNKVRNTHESHHPELVRVAELFNRLCADLAPHMRVEEGTLFPAIMQMARPDCSPASRDGLRMSIRVMHHDHQEVSSILRQLREVTSGYETPPDACSTYAALYRELAAFETDLHEHIHLENNVLMRRALSANDPPSKP